MQMVTPAVEADSEPREMNAEDQLPLGDDNAAEPIGPSDEATKLSEDSSDVVTTAESEPAADQNQEESASEQERLAPAEDAEQEVEGKAVRVPTLPRKSISYRMFFGVPLGLTPSSS